MGLTSYRTSCILSICVDTSCRIVFAAGKASFLLPDKPEKPEGKPPDKSDKAKQQQTLSVRISEALRQRLDRAKKLMSSRTGESVSTSEIAKQFLESAREDRLEVVDRMSLPTNALREIPSTNTTPHPLSTTQSVSLPHFIYPL